MSDVSPQPTFQPTWDKVAWSAAYRTADPAKKGQIRNEWFTQIAPTIYGEQMNDPLFQVQLRRAINSTDTPVKLADEDQILTPDTWDMSAIMEMERKQEFRTKNYGEQQILRRSWLHKVEQTDEDFKKLSPEEKDIYVKKILLRKPSQIGQLFPPGDINKLTDDRLRETDAENAATTFMTNFTADLVGSAFGLILTPLQWLIGEPFEAITGEKFLIKNMIEDNKRYRDWINLTDKGNPIFTQAIPSFLGTAAGIVATAGIGAGGGAASKIPTFANVERFLAGSTTFKGILPTATRGILETGARALGIKNVAPLVFQIAGGAAAGTIHDIAMNVSTGREWNDGLLGSAGLGVVAEVVQRVMGLRGAFRQGLGQVIGKNNVSEFLSSATGKSVRSTALDAAVKGLPEGDVSADLLKILAADPKFSPFVKAGPLVDEFGILLQAPDNISTLKMLGETKGVEVVEAGEKVLLKKNGQTIWSSNFGGKEAQIANAHKYLSFDDPWDTFFKSMGGKKQTEVFATTPYMQMKTGFVPYSDEARKMMDGFLTKTAGDTGTDVAGLARSFGFESRTDFLDGMLDIFRKNTPDRVADILKKRGFEFAPDSIKNNIEEITSIHNQLGELAPKPIAAYVNTKTKKLIKASDIPTGIAESPNITKIGYENGIYTGTPQQIRSLLTATSKAYLDLDTAVKKIAKTTGMDLVKHVDSPHVELRITAKGGDNLYHDIPLHFTNLSDAKKFMASGYGSQGVTLDDVFGPNPARQQAFQEFETNFKKNSSRYGQDFLPFKFAQESARLDGHYLGVVDGKYVVQDLLDEGNFRYKSFDDLRSAMDHLDTVRNTDMIPEMFKDITPGSLDTNPLKLPKETLKPKRLGVFSDLMNRFIRPAQDTFAAFEANPVIMEVTKKYNLNSPTEVFNNIRKASIAMNSFETPRNELLKQSFKGINANEEKLMSQYMEAIVHPSEKQFNLINYRLQEDVAKEMADTFGKARADELVDRANLLNDYMTKLFAGSDIGWEKFVKHYVPHYNIELNKQRGMGKAVNMSPERMTALPQTDRKAFFEFMRSADMDPAAVAEQSLSKKLQMYTHMMSRRKFMHPVLQSMTDELKTAAKNLKLNDADIYDWQTYMHYFKGVAESLNGIRSHSDEAFLGGLKQTAMHVAKTANISPTKALNLLTKLTTASHLAFRGFPVFRNLTQSLLVGGSIIGNNWWAHGLDQTLKPGSLKNLMELGVISAKDFPTTAADLFNQGFDELIKKGMIPYQWSDFVNRGIVYYGMKERAVRAVDDLLSNKISNHQFIRKSGMKLWGGAEYNRLAKIVDSTPKAKLRDRLPHELALLASDKTQYLYATFAQPTAFRSSLGKLAGQYTTWGMNFANLVYDRIRPSSGIPLRDRVEFFARLGGNQAAVAGALIAMGIDADRFMPTNSLAIQPGPYFKMGYDLIQAAGGDKQAAASFAHNASSLIPFAYTGEGIYKAVETIGEGNPWEAFLYLMTAPPILKTFPDETEMGRDHAKNLIMGGFDAYYKTSEFLSSYGGLIPSSKDVAPQ